MLVVMVALGIVLALVTATLLGAFRSERLVAGVTHRLAQQHALTDDFRADVGRAADAPDAWDQWTAGPACLILRRPDDSHVVYRWDAGGLQRHELSRSAKVARAVPLGDDNATVEFVRGGPGNRLVTLRLVEARPHGAPRQLDISAALGGDLR
jgi:hypothetical protein